MYTDPSHDYTDPELFQEMTRMIMRMAPRADLARAAQQGYSSNHEDGPEDHQGPGLGD